VVKPIKNLGQNFLRDSAVSQKMVELLNIVDGDLIIEIGPGEGVLTKLIAQKIANLPAAKYIAVEIDPRLSKPLRERYINKTNIEVVCENFLIWFPEFASKISGQGQQGQKYKVIGSIPYYITSPILHTLIKVDTRPERAVILMQKEVGQKVCANAPDSSYLSVFTGTFFDRALELNVPRNSFYPIPKVDSSVVTLKLKADISDKFEFERLKKYEGFLHKSFASPRKMLNKVFSLEELEQFGIDPKLRPQNLSAQEWLELFQLMNPL
jgi:16S rRNA (adenine1518-N6/adenine1519-N6)-dimethyltransferase